MAAGGSNLAPGFLVPIFFFSFTNEENRMLVRTTETTMPTIPTSTLFEHLDAAEKSELAEIKRRIKLQGRPVDSQPKGPAAAAVDEPITAPNLIRAYWRDADKRSIALEFDQPVVWNDALASQFYLDDTEGVVAGGSVTGHVLTVTLKEPGAFERITYLKETAWSQDNLLFGQNGMAALTFCNVPISSERENR